MQQQHYAYYNAMAQALPQLKPYKALLHVLFVLSIPLFLYTNWLGFFALLLGVIERHGKPKMSQQYLQIVMQDDDFQNIGILALLGFVN